MPRARARLRVRNAPPRRIQEDHLDNCARPVDTTADHSLPVFPLFSPSRSPFLLLAPLPLLPSPLDRWMMLKRLSAAAISITRRSQPTPQRSNSERVEMILGILPGCTTRFCPPRHRVVINPSGGCSRDRAATLLLPAKFIRPRRGNGYVSEITIGIDVGSADGGKVKPPPTWSSC